MVNTQQSEMAARWIWHNWPRWRKPVNSNKRCLMIQQRIIKRFPYIVEEQFYEILNMLQHAYKEEQERMGH